MPRPGQGTGGGSRSSSGHSSNYRSTSGHRINQSNSSFNTRPGSAQRNFSGYQNSSAGSPFRNNIPSNQGYPNPNANQNPFGRVNPGTFLPFTSLFSSRRRTPYIGNMIPPDPGPGMGTPYTYDPYGRRRRSGGMFGSLIVILIVFFFLFLIFGMIGCSSKDTSKTADSLYNREKIENNNAYQSDCIVDEVGWFENTSKTGKELKSFYDKTGIQPYIVLKDYDPSLRTDAQKAEYAKDYYEDHIADEDTFLYMYFAEPDDSTIGYMETVNGKEISSVMDKNAQEIFWNEIDNNWTTDQSTDQMFIRVFDSTADKIMTKTATKTDVAVKALPVIAVLAAAAAVIVILVIRRKHERERVEETQRILSTPLTPDNGKGKPIDVYQNPPTAENRSPEDEDDELLKRYGGK